MGITHGSQKDYKYHWNKNKGYITKNKKQTKKKNRKPKNEESYKIYENLLKKK